MGVVIKKRRRRRNLGKKKMDFGRLKGMVMGFGVEEDGGVEGVGVEVVVWCLAGNGGPPARSLVWDRRW